MKQVVNGMLAVALMAFAGCEPSVSEIRTTAITEADVGHNARAKELFQRAVARDPQDAQSAYYLGRIYYNENDYSRALYWYQEALRVDPGFEPAKLGLKRVEREDPRLYKLLVTLPIQKGDELP